MLNNIYGHFLYYEFVYVFLFCCIFFLGMSIFIKKHIVKKVLILLFAIFFMLFSFEFVLSAFIDKPVVDMPNILKPSDKKFSLTKQYQQILKNKKDGKNKKNDNNYYNHDIYDAYEVVYSIYSNGFRYVKCDINSNKTYIFLGCSFVFGDCLNDNETLPYCFSQLLNFKYNVLNYGVQGQSSNIALNILNSNIIDTEKQIDHCFYSLIKDHIDRNFRILINKPSDNFILNEGNKYIRVKQPYGIIKYVFAKSYIFRKVFLSIIDEYNKEYYENYMIESLKKMNKIVEEKYNSKLTIVVWPEDYGNRFLSKLKETNLDLIFLPNYFSSVDAEEKGYRIKGDGHPTAKANKEIAEMLYEYINNKK